MTNTRKFTMENTRKMVVMALFVALTYLANFICNFKLEFLSFEAKDAVTVICAYALGPVSGCVVALLSAVIESLTTSTTGIYGFIMNVAGSVTFVGIAGVFYKLKKNTASAVVGLTLATILMSVVMVGLNIALTPFYMKVPRETVINLIAPMLLPFNLVKGVFNSAVALVIKNPIMKAMEISEIIPKHQKTESKFAKNFVLIASVLVVVLALAYFVVMLGGKVEMFE